MIAIVDYGVGNVASIQNMFRRIGLESIVTKDPCALEAADRLVLPGVGHFKHAIQNLGAVAGLREALDHLVLDRRKPILGICVGAQLMTQGSAEGEISGLSWIAGETVRFDDRRIAPLKVPHMGWAEVAPRDDSPLWREIGTTPRFYFTHSYHFVCHVDAQISATARYGYEFTCAFRKGNIFGIQFHPEKSHRFGMRLLDNFSRV